LGEKGKKLLCVSTKKPEKEKSLHWHLFEVTVPAEVRIRLHSDAQEFHVPHDHDMTNPHLPVLSVDYDLQFRLAEKMFQMVGNADVKDTDGRIWFRVGRIASRDVNLSGEAGRFGISNARGEPLVFLQDLSRVGMLKYDISRIVKTEQGLKCVPRATIERTEQLIGANYQIFLSDGVNIAISGSISDFKTTFKDPVTGEVACSINRKFSLSSGTYSITIKKGEDIMLYLAYAVAIDKMHHEAAQGGATALSAYRYTPTLGALKYGSYGKCNACELTSNACRCFML